MTAPVLQLRDVRGGYGRVEVLHGVDLEIRPRQIVVLLGGNGAGKTTTLRGISGFVRVRGSISLDGTELVGRRSYQIARLGVAHVPQGRGTFQHLTVEDNLRAGGYLRTAAEAAEEIDRWYSHFPRLAERRRQRAGQLSGGEQQMLAVARALMMRPKVLLLDEPSLGLAPLVTQALFQQLARINAELGTTMLIVEQNAALALSVASYAYVLESGHVVVQDDAASLHADDRVRRAYLGS